MHRFLVTNLELPTELVLYPSKGRMFYLDYTTMSLIGQANMDGSNQSVLLRMVDIWPTELTFDYQNEHLYWIDENTGNIQYCNLDGTNKSNLVVYFGLRIYRIAIYQEYIFLAAAYSITKVKISNTNETTEFAAYDELGKIKSISIFSSDMENKNVFCAMDNGGCSTFCFPTPDGGICGCENNVVFIEGSDKLCSNKIDYGLIVTLSEPNKKTSQHIYTVPTATNGTPIFDYIKSLPLPGDFRFLSVGSDFQLRHVYMYDYETNAIYKHSKFSIGLSTQDNWISYHRGLSKAFIKLSVDWISHNIYWTDPGYKWIAVQSLMSNDSSMYRVLIHEDLYGPHALALDPMEALLFWSDIGIVNKIEVSSLSGRNRKTLIYSNLVKPYSLTADYMTKRIYFLDADLEVVETTTYEGRDRKILIRDPKISLFDIAVFKDYLYVTNEYDNLLYCFNKTNGEDLHCSLHRSDVSCYGVAVFHSEVQPTSDTAHCANYGCEHICVTEKDGATCLCKEGYRLNQDTRTCSLNSEYFHRGLMFSNRSSICIVDIRVVTHFSYEPKCILEQYGTKYMILDTDERQIIIANNTAIYFANVDNPVMHRLAEQSGMISGLAWDGYDRNLYWTEEDTGIIWRMSKESETAQVFLKGLKPRDIIILPHERLVYWISERNGSAIESSNLDGSNRQVVLDSLVLKDPKSLGFDQYKKRIYFLDKSTDGFSYVYSCNLDGSDLEAYNSYTVLQTLEIYKGHLLVTSNKAAGGTLITSYSIDRMIITTSGVFRDTGYISAIRVFDENIRQNETGPCYNLNGECEQICISNGKSRICACAFGFKLETNGKNCTSDPINDNFMLVRSLTDTNIFQISLKNESVQGIKTKGIEYRKGIAYNPVHNRFILGNRKSEISIMQLDGTVEKIFPVAITDDGISVLSEFAVDYSTGNIYYIVVKSLSSVYESYIGALSPEGKHRFLVTNLEFPTELVLYPSKGLMFYLDYTTIFLLGQANMDGSNHSVLLNMVDIWPTELTVDYQNEYLYWIDENSGIIQYCNLDGTNRRNLVVYFGLKIYRIAIYQEHIFIATAYSIKKVKISNTKERTDFAAYEELGVIRSITIYSSKVENKNEFCANDNGGCSTFCFPTPGGGICGCENDVDFIEGSDKLCSNITRCPKILNQIIVSDDCLRVNGSKCTFTCNEGYTEKHGVNQVLCNGTKYTPPDACEENDLTVTLLLRKLSGEDMNASFDPVADFPVSYGNGDVDIGPSKGEEPTKVSLSPKPIDRGKFSK
ncbi:hypothetical protein CHS0354_028859 [Potamilus streckersoni]|uniref:EGF-like domain-containing protein n=1 Tax=Potamilus streckersoni TaxID=2493646 RepID=A0AAE0RY48_9BIVA|nr:hypothetical protein CHS0354_028859 [Potamilus streckersoni]